MAETKQVRLTAAAKEFNIGTTSIVDFLHSKGFKEVTSSPMEKLSSEMYSALETEYASERKAKQNSEAVQLTNKVKDASAPKPAEKEAPKEAKVEFEPINVPVPLASATKDGLGEDKKVKEEAVAEVADTANANEASTTADDSSTGPVKVINKIDLSTIGKPKKTAKKKEPTPEEAPAKEITAVPVEAPAKPAAKPTRKKLVDTTDIPKVAKAATADQEVFTTSANEVKAVIVTPLAKEEEGEAPVVENLITRVAPTAPKIMGKINLPTPQPTSAEKRKRKRIVVGGGAPAPGGQGRSGGNDNRGRSGGNFDRRGPGGNNRGPAKQEDRVIGTTEIQDKIKETLAKLSGNKGKNKGAKYRKDKRELHAEKNAARENATDETELKLTEFISVNELATLMNVSFADVIGKCMNLGMMVSINQRLDAEVIELVASEFNFTVKFINLEQEADDELEDEDDGLEDNTPRPPIVTIMGHVDHGKTSLLDYIRSANVIAGEAGGITQHIGAYEVTLANGKQITFLDTPGHEAFTAMRARGAKVTDLAVIVVAADDAVMPQTREAISHAQAASVPMIFAINKIDKDGANPQKIYEQLSGMNILVEEWGGKFQSQTLAAKSGLNVSNLLDKILLESDMLDLKANPEKDAIGSVIEASLDKGRGYVATILVQNGTLEVGDMIVAGSIYGRVKAMYNERGGKMDFAGPSTPVQILGLNGAPQAGEKFKVYEDEDEAKAVATHRSQILREQGIRTRKHITLDEIGRRLALGNFKQLNVIIKGDVDGSVEALSDSLQKLSTDEVAVNVVHKAVGGISESDVLLATASDAIILGFQVRPNSQASNLADKENIEIRYYSVIYDAIDEIRSAMEGLLEPKVEQKRTANIEVRQVFKVTGVGSVAGCFVLDGKMLRSHKINIIRDGIVVHTGELASLKRYKDDAKEVVSGMECGLNIKNYNDIKEGDIIEGFEEIEIKRTL
jgi:translation initiation factor IF-2